MLCYRCGSHVPDTADQCPTCGQSLNTGELRQATATFSRRRASASVVDGAPFKAQELVADRYLIKDTVGAGPLGFVFRAHDKEIDVEVALKVIRPRLVQSADERKNFARLLRGARKLSHPHLVRVYEEGEDRECPYFTSQFLDALTLRRIIDLRLQKGSFFTLQEIEPIIAQVCAALEGAHKVGPHSDLKPENVLVLPDLLKVTDFGLGLALPRMPFAQAMKATKADRYLAPELIEEREVDHRSDLYSVGVILGEMLSGLTPDGAAPELSLVNPLIPAGLEAIYRRAVNANPNARYQTPAELAADLSELAQRSAPSAVEAPRRPGPVPSPAPVRAGRTEPHLPEVKPSPAPPPLPSSPSPPPPPPPLALPPASSVEDSGPSDATQPVDPRLLAEALKANLRPDALFRTLPAPPTARAPTASSPPSPRPASPPPAVPRGRVPVLDEEDRRETRVGLEALAPAAAPFANLRDQGSKSWVPVVLLIVVGVALGAGGGLLVVHQGRSTQPPPAGRGEGAAPVAAAPVPPRPPEPGPTPAPTPEPAKEPAKDADSARPSAPEKGPERAAAVKAVPGRGCPEGTRPVAAGSFKMGTAPADPMMSFDEKALTTTTVAAFCIDVYEYPNQRGTQPLVGVTWADGQRLCEERGRRLCTEAEWEKACKGPAALRWPYGDTFDATTCNTEDEAGDPRALGPSGRSAKCRSGFGVMDLSGNVSEWTQEKVMKGGSYASSDYAVRCSARKSTSGAKTSEVGFRCCVDWR